jgi:hypothetical protein
VTICPCCGFKFNGALTDGCAQCGARAVGVALPKPAIVLPSYGRSLVLTVAGSLTVLLFVVQTSIAMVQRGFNPLGFWSWVAAAETAAWRLKWISIPIAVIALWLGRKLYRSIKQHPDRFCGLTYARRGLMASMLVPALIAVLIGVTVPVRLQRRAWGLEAADIANRLRISSALNEYRTLYKTLPDKNRLKEDLAKLPDRDGSLAIALRELDLADYQPRAEIAANASRKRSLRGAAIERASLTSATDDATPAGLAFIHYDLHFPGEDNILNTEDDWIDRDGVVMRLADVAKGGIGQTAGSLKP